jgi:hypothetical protein
LYKDHSKRSKELEPILYVIMMLTIFMLAFTCQLSFNYGSNKRHAQMYTSDKFVKEWLSSNTHIGSTRKQRKRVPHYRRVSNAKSMINFEESNLLSKVSKSSRSSKFSIYRSYTRISHLGRSRQSNKPKIFLEEPTYCNEVPEITVMHSDNYSSHDSSKTY